MKIRYQKANGVLILRLVMALAFSGCGNGYYVEPAGGETEGEATTYQIPTQSSANSSSSVSADTEEYSSQQEYQPREEREKVIAKVASQTLQPRPCHKTDASTCQIELFIHKFTNEFRAENGKEPLGFNKQVGYVSRLWSQQQYDSGDLSHEGFPGKRVESFKKEFGSINVSINGENVAFVGGRNISERDVARLIVDLWIDSPGHRENLLSGFDLQGIGVYVGATAVYATQIFGRK